MQTCCYFSYLEKTKASQLFFHVLPSFATEFLKNLSVLIVSNSSSHLLLKLFLPGYCLQYSTKNVSVTSQMTSILLNPVISSECFSYLILTRLPTHYNVLVALLFYYFFLIPLCWILLFSLTSFFFLMEFIGLILVNKII